MKIRVVIIEDEKNYNNALYKIIKNNDDMECVGRFYNGSEAVDHMKNLHPDVALIDIKLPDLSGIEVVNKLKPKMPSTQFVMCTSFEDNDLIYRALKEGASGYLIKGESLEKIIQSIKEVYNGGAPMSFSVAKRVLSYFHSQNFNVAQLNELTANEKETLELLAKGLLYKEIAEKKFITIDTVKKHVGSIYRKLHVSNKIEAVNIFNGKKL